MPQFLVTLMLRYGSAGRINRARDPLDVIANGQFILIRREAYEAIGGHEGVRGEVAEDLRLAQRTVAAGRRLLMAHAEELMSTRMYESLREILAGWSKNVATGGRQTVSSWLRPALPYLIAAWFVLMWVMPPAVVALALQARVDDAVVGWSAGATAASLLFWLSYARFGGVLRIHVLLYPIGALVAAWIFVRSVCGAGGSSGRGDGTGGAGVRGGGRVTTRGGARGAIRPGAAPARPPWSTTRGVLLRSRSSLRSPHPRLPRAPRPPRPWRGIPAAPRAHGRVRSASIRLGERAHRLLSAGLEDESDDGDRARVVRPERLVVGDRRAVADPEDRRVPRGRVRGIENPRERAQSFGERPGLGQPLLPLRPRLGPDRDPFVEPVGERRDVSRGPAAVG